MSDPRPAVYAELYEAAIAAAMGAAQTVPEGVRMRQIALLGAIWP